MNKIHLCIPTSSTQYSIEKIHFFHKHKLGITIFDVNANVVCA